MMKIGFDSKKYLELQTAEIFKRAAQFDNKLYIEFGGKLFDDYHASRVLPGFNPDNKIKVLEKIKDKTEIIYCISASDIEKNRIRGDSGLTYDLDVLRSIDELRSRGLSVTSVVITLYTGQPQATRFAEKLKNRNERVYFHTYTKGYPTDIKTIVSDEGYGANPYIETSRPIVLITAPGAKSGKLATCLSQLYHEHKRGVKAGYTKYETFPIWNLPLKHPVNFAYEAATADIKDTNMIDPYHFNAYGKVAVNYNRDIEVFPVVKEILSQITGNDEYYKSPTDMGVNMAGFAICDNEACEEASKQEIVRRFYRYQAEAKKGMVDADAAERVKLIINELKIETSMRKVIGYAEQKHIASGEHSVALELKDGTIITGKNQDILTAPAGAILNALKHLCGISDDIKLVSPQILKCFISLKTKTLKLHTNHLTIDDVLTSLAISSTSSDLAEKCLSKARELEGCELHSTCIMTEEDEDSLRHLGINFTSDPTFSASTLLDN